jgi:dihydroflavonol-4-reductase
MKVLVTGATGFLGQWLTRRLVADGYQVRILKRALTSLDTLVGLDLDVVVGDVTDLESVRKACVGMNRVYHLAGHIAYTRRERAAMQRANVDGTQNVVTACLEAKVSRLLHLSSVVAIGASYTPTSLSETAVYNMHPLDLGYFETKKAAEDIVLLAHKEKGLDVVCVNPSTIYGAGDAKKGSRKTQLKVAKGEFPIYPGGGVNVVAVEDVIDIIIRAADNGESGQRYIACGENLTIKKLFELIAIEASVSPPKIFMPSFAIHVIGRAGDFLESIGKKGPINSENAWTSTLFHWFDGTKAQIKFSIKPKPAKVAIANSVGWMREQGLLEKK